MTRTMFAGALLTAVGLTTSQALGAPLAQRSDTTVTEFRDKNNDVRFDPFGQGGGDQLVGAYSGDIRLIRAGIGTRRTAVRVKFDRAKYAGQRLTLSVTFAAPTDDTYGYVAELGGDMADGDPDPVFYKFIPGPYNPVLVDCSGFRTSTDQGVWRFSIPKSCMTPKRFDQKDIVVRSSYYYDDGTAGDRFPNQGTQTIK